MPQVTYPIIIPEHDFKSDPDLNSLVDILTIVIMKAVTLVKDNFHYILSAVLLNPVLFLHATNALCTTTSASKDIPHLLASFVEPHIDINNNNHHAIVYTIFITIAQLKACQRCIGISHQQKLLKAPGNSSDEDDYWEGDSSTSQENSHELD